MAVLRIRLSFGHRQRLGAPGAITPCFNCPSDQVVINLCMSIGCVSMRRDRMKQLSFGSGRPCPSTLHRRTGRDRIVLSFGSCPSGLRKLHRCVSTQHVRYEVICPLEYSLLMHLAALPARIELGRVSRCSGLCAARSARCLCEGQVRRHRMMPQMMGLECAAVTNGRRQRWMQDATCWPCGQARVSAAWASDACGMTLPRSPDHTSCS